MSRGLRTLGWIVSLAGAAWLGRISARPHAPHPAQEEARSPSVADTQEVDGLRVQVALLSARLAAAERGARSPAPSAVQASQPAPTPPEAPPAPVDSVFEDLEVAHATGQHDAGSAAAETYLRDLAGTMPVPVPLRSVSCTKETCRLEVGATADAQGARMVQNFLNRASERLPQFTVQSDPLTGGTVVVLAREGTSLPDAEGGGLAN